LIPNIIDKWDIFSGPVKVPLNGEYTKSSFYVKAHKSPKELYTPKIQVRLAS